MKWEKVDDWRQVKKGDVAKLVVESTFGWSGRFFVEYVQPRDSGDHGLHGRKIGTDSTRSETIDCLLSECLILK